MSLMVPSIEGINFESEEGVVFPLIGTLLAVTAVTIWWLRRPSGKTVTEVRLPSGLVISVGYGVNGPNKC